MSDVLPFKPISADSLPRPGLKEGISSLAVIAACAGASGYLLHEALEAWRWDGNIYFGFAVLFPLWLAWLQCEGTIRRHERRANSAGNWLFGVASIAAICLAAMPMVAATPLTGAWTALTVLLIVGGSIAGWISLAWARRLRNAGWDEAEHTAGRNFWSFAISDLMILMVLVAITTASYLHFSQFKQDTNRIRRNYYGTLKLKNQVPSLDSAVPPMPDPNRLFGNTLGQLCGLRNF